MSSKEERKAAREAVARYHEQQLAELVERVGPAIDRLRADEIDAFETDHALFQCSRAAKELWKFCNLGNVDLAASLLADEQNIDWWQKANPTKER